MKDLHNNIEVTSLLHAIAVATTQTITDIDLSGCNSAELVIDAGADGGGVGLSSSNKIVFTLKHSDDGTTYAAVEDKDMLGVSDITSGTILTIDGTDEDDTVYHFGYIGGKRFRACRNRYRNDLNPVLDQFGQRSLAGFARDLTAIPGGLSGPLG
jgi:hypothetical protein